MKDFSQRGEQEVILQVVRDWQDHIYGGPLVARFLDIGANDGVTFSNTRALALSGWAGVSVEPSPKAYAALKKTYEAPTNVACYNLAISEYDTNELTFYEFPDSLVSTTDPSHRDLWADKGPMSYETIEVPSQRPKTFLLNLGHSQFDLVNIDAEGISPWIAMNIPFEEMGPPAIVVVEYDKSLEALSRHMVTKLGYSLIHISEENAIYVHRT